MRWADRGEAFINAYCVCPAPPLLLECLCEIQDYIKKELQEAAYRSEMSDPERKNKKFEHYDNSQKKFFGAVTRAIEKEYGTAGEELSRMKTEEEK